MCKEQLFVLVCLFPCAAMATMQDQKADAPAPQQMQATLPANSAAKGKPHSVPRKSAKSRVDARSCLDFTENIAVIRCAEKYR